jgi:hypothetical protein
VYTFALTPRDYEELVWLNALIFRNKPSTAASRIDTLRSSHREASIDEVPCESDFQPRRKLPPLFKRLPWVRLLLLLIEI